MHNKLFQRLVWHSLQKIIPFDKNKSWGILLRSFLKRHENILEIILFLRNDGKMKFPALTTKYAMYLCISEAIDQKERGIWTCKHIWNCWKAGKVMHEGEVKILNSSVYGPFCKILHRCHGLFSLRIVEMETVERRWETNCRIWLLKPLFFTYWSTPI